MCDDRVVKGIHRCLYIAVKMILTQMHVCRPEQEYNDRIDHEEMSSYNTLNQTQELMIRASSTRRW